MEAILCPTITFLHQRFFHQGSITAFVTDHRFTIYMVNSFLLLYPNIELHQIASILHDSFLSNFHLALFMCIRIFYRSFRLKFLKTRPSLISLMVLSNFCGKHLQSEYNPNNTTYQNFLSLQGSLQSWSFLSTFWTCMAHLVCDA